MTREEYLTLCKNCKNQKFSMTQGIICRFTNKMADFENNCNLFEEDIDLINRLKRTKITNETTTSSGKRFANLILDTLFYTIFYIVFLFMFLIILKIVSPSTIFLQNENMEILNALFIIIMMILYYSTMEALTGRTIAKYITKTKVVNEKGDIPGYGAILLRTLCRLIPFDAFSFFEEDNSGWHDKLSKTKVIEI